MDDVYYNIYICIYIYIPTLNQQKVPSILFDYCWPASLETYPKLETLGTFHQGILAIKHVCLLQILLTVVNDHRIVDCVKFTQFYYMYVYIYTYVCMNT